MANIRTFIWEFLVNLQKQKNMLKELKAVYQQASNQNNQQPNEGVVQTLGTLQTQSLVYTNESVYQ